MARRRTVGHEADEHLKPAHDVPPGQLYFAHDEYMRNVLHNLEPGKTIYLPTPWGRYGLTLKADGTLEVYMASHGPTQYIHVGPKATNMVEIIPSR